MTVARQGPELGPGVETFLKSAGRGFLVTRRSDGSPTTHPLTPLWRDGAIHINTYRKSAKVQNVLRHPKVSYVITSADDDPSYFAVECRGTAVMLDLADVPDSLLGVSDDGRVMSEANLEQVRKNVASGKRVYLRVIPEEWVVCEPLVSPSAVESVNDAIDAAALTEALVGSRIAMNADEAEGFLRQKQVAVLGTVDGDGTPRARPVRYAVGRRALHLMVPRSSPSLHDLAEKPVASATIEEFPSYNAIRGVMAHGPTRFFADVHAGATPEEWTEVGLRLDRVLSFDFSKIERAH
jgi:general stress protein 26